MGSRFVARIARLTPGRYFALLSGYAVFLGTAQVAAVALSLLQVPLAQPVALAVLGVSCGAGLAAWHRLRQLDTLKCDAPAAPTPCRWPVYVAVFAALALGLLGLAGFVEPDLSWDGGAYHIPTIHQWAARGYVHWIPGGWNGHEPCMNGYPKGVELMSLLICRAFASSDLVNTANVFFLPLGVLGIGCLSALLGAGSEWALCAGALFALAPVNVAQATTTYVDTAYGCCVIALLAVTVCTQAHLLQRRRLPPGYALALGASAGLALASKGTGPLPVLLGFLLLGATALARCRGRGVAHSVQMLGVLASAAAIGVLVGGFWYIRNYLATGTPLYPVSVTLAGHTLFTGVPVAQALSAAANTPAEMLAWPTPLRVAATWAQGLTRWPQSIWEYGSLWGGLGFLWPFGCLPALILAGCRPRSVAAGRRSLLLGAVGLTALAFLATPMNWWVRYTLWIYGAGLAVWGAVVSTAWRETARNDRLRVWSIACVAIALLEGSLCLARQVRVAYPRPLRPNPLGILRPANWQWSATDQLPWIRGTVIEPMIAGNAPVAIGHLTFGPDAGRRIALLGRLCMPLGRRTLVSIGGEPPQLAARLLDAAGVRYVLWDERTDVPAWLIQASARDDRVAGMHVFTLAEGRPHLPRLAVSPGPGEGRSARGVRVQGW